MNSRPSIPSHSKLENEMTVSELRSLQGDLSAWLGKYLTGAGSEASPLLVVPTLMPPVEAKLGEALVASGELKVLLEGHTAAAKEKVEKGRELRDRINDLEMEAVHLDVCEALEGWLEECEACLGTSALPPAPPPESLPALSLHLSTIGCMLRMSSLPPVVASYLLPRGRVVESLTAALLDRSREAFSSALQRGEDGADDALDAAAALFNAARESDVTEGFCKAVESLTREEITYGKIAERGLPTCLNRVLERLQQHAGLVRELRSELGIDLVRDAVGKAVRGRCEGRDLKGCVFNSSKREVVRGNYLSVREFDDGVERAMGGRSKVSDGFNLRLYYQLVMTGVIQDIENVIRLAQQGGEGEGEGEGEERSVGRELNCGDAFSKAVGTFFSSDVWLDGLEVEFVRACVSSLNRVASWFEQGILGEVKLHESKSGETYKWKDLKDEAAVMTGEIGKVLSAVASCEENAVKLVGRGDSSVCEAISEVFSQVRERYEEIQDGAWKCVVDIVVSQCKEGLKAVAGVPATYRMTNR